MNRNSNGMSIGMALLCTLEILLFIGWMIDLGTPKCIKSGCDNDAKDGSNTSFSSKSSSITSNSKKTYSSGSSSSKKSQSSMDSYDDGYNAICEDDDYDWDCYWNDDDYAAGVDDAMEDEDW